LEIVLSKIKSLNSNAQILALSATVKNGKQIAEWLKAKLVDMKWRPVPLKEGVALNSKIYFNDGSVDELQHGYGDSPIGIALDSVKKEVRHLSLQIRERGLLRWLLMLQH